MNTSSGKTYRECRKNLIGRNRQKGATLIEVLVSALVLGVGLIGIELMQARALQFNQQAYLYSQASVLANDIADRIRANPNAVDTYESEDDSYNGDRAPSNTCMTSRCNAESLAKWDLAHWKYMLKNTLPQGNGTITKDGDQYIIKTIFDDSRGQDSLRELAITIQI